jgi:hypothetical protein
MKNLQNYTKYQLLAEGTNLKLTKDVNKLLKEGWELYGYPFIQDGLFFQAVTKTSSKKDKSDETKE